MTDRHDSEALTDGSIAQTAGERCKNCGEPLDKHPGGSEIFGEALGYCVQSLRRQLAQAQERAEEWHEAWRRAMMREIRLSLAMRGTAGQLRRMAQVVGCDSGLHPDEYDSESPNDCGLPECVGHMAQAVALAIDNALSSPPENPYAAVVEAARTLCELDPMERGPVKFLEAFDALEKALSNLPGGGDDG